jgi:integrase/recombinase XerD
VNLERAVRLYVERKLSFGFHYEYSCAIHRSLLRSIGDVPLRSITPRQIEAFLNGPRTGNSAWHQKYDTLERFFRFWVSRGKLKRVPMPRAIPKQPVTFVSYIYSRAELRRLLDATLVRKRRCRCVIAPETLRTFLLFLYATGVLVGEAVALLRRDIDFSKETITVRSSYPGRTRVIPIGPAVHKLLSDYLRSRVRQQHRAATVFVDNNGKAISRPTLVGCFQRVRKTARVTRHVHEVYQPRMHDLRHTFAVHRLTSWYEEGENVVVLLPALAAYMGHVGIGAMERYLSLTPAHYRRQVTELSAPLIRKRSLKR